MTDELIREPGQSRLEALERRVAELETEVARIRRPATSTPLTEAPAVAGTPMQRARWGPPQPAAPPVQPSERVAPGGARFNAESETILKWGGVALVVLAVIFAVSTAIGRGWIGPPLQLAGAALLAAGLVAGGWRLRERRPGWGQALLIGGVLAAEATAASALFRDQLGRPASALTAMAATLAALVLARAARLEPVATVALTAGVIATAAILQGFDPVVASILWLLVLGAATVGLGTEQRWHALRLLGFLATMIALIPAIEHASSDHRVLVVIAVAAVVGALAWVPSIGDLASTWQQIEVQSVILAAPWSLAMIAMSFDVDSDEPFGVLALGVAAVFVAVAVIIRRHIQRAHFVSLVIGSSVATTIGLGALVAELISDSTIPVVLAVQGAGLVVLARALGDRLRILVNAGLLLGIATIATFVMMADGWSDDARIGDDVARLVVIAAIAFAGWSLSGVSLRALRDGAALAVLFLVLTWLGSVFVHLPQGQAIVSGTWAVLGTAVLVLGAARRDRRIATVGLVVLGVTVAKLLTVDLSEVDTLWRALLFLAVGLGLLRLGFLLPRLMAESPTEPGVPPPDGGEQVDPRGRP